jgi:RNA polymerase sigma factor (sigma-70 family)
LSTNDPFDGDPRLLEAYRRGDPAIYRRIIGNFTSSLKAFLRRELGRGMIGISDVDDLVQGTFVNAFRAREDYDPTQGTYAGYLTRIASNLLIDAARSANSKPRHESLEKDPVATEPTTEEELLQIELVVATEDYLDTLRQKARELVRLVHEEGLPLTTAADRMGLKRGKARGLHAEVLDGLRAFLRKRGLDK